MKKLVLLIVFFTCVCNIKAQYYDYEPDFFQFEIMLGGAQSKGDIEGGILSVEMVGGVRINPFFFAGLGLNCNLNMTSGEELTTMSYFANFKVYLPSLYYMLYPFASLNIGYVDGLHDLYQYGFGQL